MTTDRHLDWDGCWNARHLGGLRTKDGGRTRPAALVRSEAPQRLSADGWAAAEAFGIRTVLDLRDRDEAATVRQAPPPGMTMVSVPIEDGLDAHPVFARWRSTARLLGPLYYAEFLERWPDRCAEAVAAIADAPAGGVLVHCARGRDRTGLVVALVLGLVGVEPDEIVADFLMSDERLRTPRARALGRDDDTELIEARLRSEGGTVDDLLRAFLEMADVAAALQAGGLTDSHIRLLRNRLLA